MEGMGSESKVTKCDMEVRREGVNKMSLPYSLYVCQYVCMYVSMCVCVPVCVCVSALWSGSEGVETLCTPLIHISPELPNI